MLSFLRSNTCANRCINVSLAILLMAVGAFACAHQEAQEQDPQQQDSEQTSQHSPQGSPQQQPTTTENSNQSADASSAESMTANAWMRRLSDTVKALPFEIGYVVSSPRHETMPYLWRHIKTENGIEIEQLSSLNGPGFEQIRIGNKVSIFEPGVNPISIKSDAIDGPIPSAFIYHPEQLDDGYDVLLMGRDRVSGRMAQQIRIVSKDKSRYQYKLWLDEQTGLLLKQNTYDLKGNLLKQILVTQLTVNDNVKEYFVNIQPSQLPPVTTLSNQESAELAWKLGFIPKGMRAITQQQRVIANSNQVADYIMLSDGLVEVSVYVTEAIESAQENLAYSFKTTNIVSISDGSIQVTVVGDLPAETANKIASSIIVL